MNKIDYQALRDNAESTIGILENIAGFEPSDIDGDTVELRFETDGGFDTGCDLSIVGQCQKAADAVRVLLDELEASGKLIDTLRQDKDKVIDMSIERVNKLLSRAEAAEKRIAELESLAAPKLTQQALVVPAEMTPKQASRSYCGEVRGYRDGWNACRAAMLQAGNFRENKDSSTNNFRETSETSTNSPVIPDGLSTVCAEAYQVVGVMADALGVFGDAAVQKVLDNLSQQKLVHRDVLPFSLPVTPDGWISCSERMPEKNQNVLISVNFDSDLVEPLICSARYTGSTFRRGGVTVMPGNGIEQATHWMPLPEPPQEVNRG